MIWTAPQDKETENTALKSKTQKFRQMHNLLLTRLLSGPVELETESDDEE
jgi:hypothetical protein